MAWNSCLSHTSAQGSFPVIKRTGTLRIWRAREREPIWGSGGGAPSGVQGQSPWSGGRNPPEAEGILLPKRANLSLSFKWNLNFAAICRKGPEQRSGDQKKNRNGVPVRSGSKRTLLVPLGWTGTTWKATSENAVLAHRSMQIKVNTTDKKKTLSKRTVSVHYYL